MPEARETPVAELEELVTEPSLGSQFLKLEVLMGKEALKRLTRAHVVVLGVGGVGSNCIEALARGGIGKLTFLDRDVVSPSNINRQAIAFHSTVGMRKVDVMEAMVKDINPNIEVVKVFDFLRQQGVEAFLNTYAKNADYVVDALDTISTKLKIAELAPKYPFRLISSMGGANKIHPECFKIADLYDTLNCPLCRIMRKEGRKRGITHLKVIYSSEKPVESFVEGKHERNERFDLGTASFVPPIFGQMIAGEVIRDIAQIGNGEENQPSFS